MKTSTSPDSGQRLSILLICTIALLNVVAPLATDLYLPTFPEMRADLGATDSGVQLTLTSFMIGLVIGQLVFGPLSDRYGRLKPLIAGVLLCAVGSTLVTIAPDITTLNISRVLQGIGGAAGMVIGRSIITDLAYGQAAARAFNIMQMLNGVVPIIAPVIGGLLAESLGWRGLMGITLGLAVVQLIAVVLVVRESLPVERRSQHLAADPAGTDRKRQELGGRQFIGYFLIFAFSFGVLMSYISASPFVVQDLIGLDMLQYGFVFGGYAVLITLVTAISAALARSVGPVKLVRYGVGIAVIGVLAFGVQVLLGVAPVWYLLTFFVFLSSMGLLMGNATALAMAAVPTYSGLASAVIGAGQFGVGALVAPLVGLSPHNPAVALAWVLLGVVAVMVIGLLIVGRSTQTASDRRLQAAEER